MRYMSFAGMMQEELLGALEYSGRIMMKAPV